MTGPRTIPETNTNIDKIPLDQTIPLWESPNPSHDPTPPGGSRGRSPYPAAIAIVSILLPVLTGSSPQPQPQPMPSPTGVPTVTPTPDLPRFFYHATNQASALNIVRGGVDTTRTRNMTLGPGFYTWTVESHAEETALNLVPFGWPPDAAVVRITMSNLEYEAMRSMGLVEESAYNTPDGFSMTTISIFRPGSESILNSPQVKRDWKMFDDPSWTGYSP